MIRVGLVDADLLDNGTRHPNLTLLKIAGFLKDNDVTYELIIDPKADISQYDHVYMSKVFTFTREPVFYLNATQKELCKFHVGGTGYYANESNTATFKQKRSDDMTKLERDDFLSTLQNKRGGSNKNGINMVRQMPDYHLYDKFIEQQELKGVKREKYKDYTAASIGFLTRRCYRHCPFCVNRLENGVVPYSKLEWFHDKSRPVVYFWDDNFLAAPYQIWKPTLQMLIDRKIKFQFRQGLDERQLSESEHGEEMAEMLSKARYHGDYIFAFDNWKDRETVEKALKIWKRYNPKKTTKFYLFCGFKQECDNNEKFYKDIWELFQRIKILMNYGCLGYVMRHEDYHKSPVPNLYVQVARWCNQPAFFRKTSFKEFCDINQKYHERNGGKSKCKSIRTIEEIKKLFPMHRKEIDEMFNYKMTNLIKPEYS